MAEFFFIATVIFAAYVIYSVTGEDKPTAETQPVKPNPDSQPQTQKKPAAATAPTKQPTDTPKATTAARSSTATNKVRNPETGETAIIPSNYRFTKRWIKEALVSEGLLDKIYKNTELDAEASVKVKAALATFKTLEKYRA